MTIYGSEVHRAFLAGYQAAQEARDAQEAWAEFVVPVHVRRGDEAWARAWSIYDRQRSGNQGQES